MVREIIWDRDPIIDVEDKSILRKVRRVIRSFEDKIENVHPAVKWIIAIFIGGVVAKLLDIVLSTYFIHGFESLAEVNIAFRIQFLIDFIFILIIIILVLIVVKMSRRK